MCAALGKRCCIERDGSRRIVERDREPRVATVGRIQQVCDERIAIAITRIPLQFDLIDEYINNLARLSNHRIHRRNRERCNDGRVRTAVEFREHFACANFTQRHTRDLPIIFKARQDRVKRCLAVHGALRIALRSASSGVFAQRVDQHAILVVGLDPHVAGGVVDINDARDQIKRGLQRDASLRMIVRARESNRRLSCIRRAASTAVSFAACCRACRTRIVDSVEVGRLIHPRVDRVEPCVHDVLLRCRHRLRKREWITQMILDVEPDRADGCRVVLLSPKMPKFMGECALILGELRVSKRCRARSTNRSTIAAVGISEEPAVDELWSCVPRGWNLILSNVVECVEQRRGRRVDIRRPIQVPERRTVVIPITHAIDATNKIVAIARLNHRRRGQAPTEGVVDRHVRQLHNLAALKISIEDGAGVVRVIRFNDRAKRIHGDNEIHIRTNRWNEVEIQRVIEIGAVWRDRRNDRTVRAVQRRACDLHTVGVHAHKCIDAWLRGRLPIERDLHPNRGWIEPDQRGCVSTRLKSLRHFDRGNGEIHCGGCACEQPHRDCSNGEK